MPTVQSTLASAKAGYLIVEWSDAAATLVYARNISIYHGTTAARYMPAVPGAGKDWKHRRCSDLARELQEGLQSPENDVPEDRDVAEENNKPRYGCANSFTSSTISDFNNFK